MAVVVAAWASYAPAAAVAERVTFQTDDGVTLSGTWYAPSVQPAPAVILVHMLKRSHHDFELLGSRLAQEGIGALAFDLRGHGDSSGSAADYAPLVQDVRAARRFLGTRGDVMPSRLGIAGGSLGASLALLAAAGDPGILGIALLSPTLDYRGLRIDAAARAYTRPMLLVASDDDGYARRTVRDLGKGGRGAREAVMLSQAGHGTVMLSRDPDLIRRLVEWFRRTLL